MLKLENLLENITIENSCSRVLLCSLLQYVCLYLEHEKEGLVSILTCVALIEYLLCAVASWCSQWKGQWTLYSYWHRNGEYSSNHNDLKQKLAQKDWN